MPRIKKSTDGRGNASPYACPIGWGYMELLDNQYLNLNLTKPNLNQTKPSLGSGRSTHSRLPVVPCLGYIPKSTPVCNAREQVVA